MVTIATFREFFVVGKRSNHCFGLLSFCILHFSVIWHDKSLASQGLQTLKWKINPSKSRTVSFICIRLSNYICSSKSNLCFLKARYNKLEWELQGRARRQMKILCVKDVKGAACRIWKIFPPGHCSPASVSAPEGLHPSRWGCCCCARVQVRPDAALFLVICYFFCTNTQIFCNGVT